MKEEISKKTSRLELKEKLPVGNNKKESSNTGNLGAENRKRLCMQHGEI
ncbi:hypothetical protein HQ529_03445 [Candidatus Woesearchaeota archaeon]|nr:hypothetical protein [Candidatus Woesearchaeota archaeon]